MKYWSNSQAGDYSAVTESKQEVGALCGMWRGRGDSQRKLNCPMSKYEKSIETKVKRSKT